MLSRDDYLKLPLEKRFVPLDEAKAARANRLFDDLTTVDLHTHIFGSLHFSFDYERIRQIGVAGLFEAVPAVSEDFDESMRLLGTYNNLVRRQPGLISATKADDIRRAKREGKQAVLFQLEPQTVGRDLKRIEIAYGLGIRMMLLTFNTKNYLGDGCSERTDCGLSYLGIEAVRCMNDLGIMIDLSHCGVQTSLDTCKHTKSPVLFNHTGARALNSPCKRLKTDEQIRAVADTGGLIGICAIPNQLSRNPEQGVEDMMNHIEYVARLVGIDHVAIGLDNVDGDQVGHHRKMAATNIVNLERSGIVLAADYMYGIESPQEWRNIVRALVSRGFSDEEITKIVSGNALRVIEQVAG